MPKADTAVTEKGVRCQEVGLGSLLVKTVWHSEAKLSLRGRDYPENH